PGLMKISQVSIRLPSLSAVAPKNCTTRSLNTSIPPLSTSNTKYSASVIVHDPPNVLYKPVRQTCCGNLNGVLIQPNPVFVSVKYAVLIVNQHLSRYFSHCTPP